MKQTKHLCTLALSAALLLAACSKNDGPSSPNNGNTAKPLDNGLYVSNEGVYPTGTATLTYYDSASKQPTTDIFSNVNDTALGIVGNGMIVYGSKLYVVVNGSNLIAVINKRNSQLIKQIKGSSEWSPRSIIPYNGKVLVSAYDMTVSMIDTSSLEVTNTVTVGANPEGLAVSGTNLYVANSGGYNPVFDSTVSIVDLNTMKETKKLKVGCNPQKVVTDSKGNVYVFTWGNYADIPYKIYKIDGASQTVTDSSSVVPAYDKMTIYNDVLYLDGSSNQPVLTLNTNNIEGNFSNFVTDGTTLTAPYVIDVDETDGDVYVTDAADFSNIGQVYCFDKNGKKKFSFQAGKIPDKVVFLR